MSDSHRHSRRSSTSHRTSSTRHSSLRNLAATLTSSTNRSSSSVNRASGGSSGSRHAGSSGNSNSGGASNHRSSGNPSNPSNPSNSNPNPNSNPSTIHTANQIYGATSRGASTSRFSLTDQFAATRSVYDFGFDDAASSVFDTASIFSVGTARAPSTRTPSIAPSSGWDYMDASTHSYGSSVGGDTVMLGYSALLEEDEDEMRMRQQLQRQSSNDDDEDEEEEDDDDEETEDGDGQHTPKQSEAGGDSKVLPEKLSDELLQLQEDQLLQATLPGDVQPTRRTYYELLCLARHPAPRPGQIRAAYFRLFRLLNGSGPSGFPKALQPTAAFYFAQVQAAFETLIDPARRLEYDRYLDDAEEEEAEEGNSSDADSDVGVIVTAADLAADKAAEEEEARRLRDLASKQSFQTATDMGIRYDASRMLLPLSMQHNEGGSGGSALSSVDYSLTQSVRVGLPKLGRYTEMGIQQLQRRVCAARYALQQRIRAVRAGQAGVVTKKTVHQPPPPQPWPVFCSMPIVGVTASTYAVTSTFASIRSNRTAPLSSDRHQPLLPEVLAPARLIQLADTRSTGRVVLHYRQEFAWGTSPNRLPPTVADVEAEVLPRLSVTTRVSQTIPVTVPRVDEKVGVRPGEPVHVEVMVQDGKSSSLTGASDPRVGLGLSRRMGRGNAFVCADSGNGWVQSPSDGPDWTSPFFVPFISPMLEVGYSLTPQELGMQAGRPLTGPADRGLKGVDEDLSVLGGSRNFGGDSRQSTWTASAAVAGPMMLAGYLRYGRTLSLTPWKLGTTKPKKAKTAKADRTVRVEAEVCASRFLSDGYVAVRGLAPVRWWGARSDWTSGPATSVTPPRLGLEVAMSAGSGSVHVSLYWSRAGQRVKLPFLLLPASAGLGVVSRLFLWAVTVPAAVLATREVVYLYQRTRRRLQRKRLSKQKTEKTKEKEGPAELDFDEEQAIARHRTEADELTMVLSSAVDARSRKVNGHRRDSLETKAMPVGSLVILSAKYGVAQGDDEEDDDDDDDDNDNAAAKLRSLRSHQRYNSASSTVSMATRNGWAPEFEVADVTAAVAALVLPGDASSGNTNGSVDNTDTLYIPRGVRKSRLLGFWDPAPHFRAPPPTTTPTQASGQRKVLHVRYLWRGKERIAEVGDGDALRLP